ncbi:helix-turn-helix domain-containing protein [Paenibacillus gansuensis]|uniref:Helix-turn-helix domain-containing protein n=1 Tax=Paenibacillus gansuensis TaxID=306542 RepID=A0ABW5PKC8_9BACL
MIRLTLDRLMEARGLTQNDIIEMTGISRNTVKALAANANTRIDFPTLDALCEGLNVKPAELIEYIPNKKDGSSSE